MYSSFTFNLEQFNRFTCIIHLYHFITMFYIRHTCYSLRFSLVIFTENIFVQFFCYSFTVSQIQLFSPILQFQTCNSLHHFLTVCSSVTRSKFQVSSFVFLQKNFFFCTVLLYRKFSHLVQFYSFKLAIFYTIS